ncbi:hypothetical protein V6x_19330 [Gimesia chilikensis]|uniref:Uncharacterized protein n=1 Tax=Gimesia chilikensis TaxID=2605989 RepID=A0A517WAG3_9PLAN|nr:hypothetical protein [Gimesia chilikensis]QDU02231.1 hypothetical protein V6x_19330 [Gimesia chilikensis]
MVCRLDERETGLYWGLILTCGAPWSVLSSDCNHQRGVTLSTAVDSPLLTQANGNDMSNNGLATDSITLTKSRLAELLKDTQFLQLTCQQDRERISITGHLKTYYALQVLLTAISLQHSGPDAAAIALYVTVGAARTQFETHFSKREHHHDQQLSSGHC